MKYTNKYGLPEAFVRAVENDPYNKGESDFSATELSGFETPRAYALKKKFYDTLEVDVTTRVASIIGQGAHSIAERAARPGKDICEKRYFADFIIDGKKYVISAQVDLLELDTRTLYDWKTTKAYAFSKKAGSGKKPDWIAQLNIAREILGRQAEPIVVDNLRIIAMLKDWLKREAGSGGMPESEVLEVELPIWGSEKTIAFIEAQVRERVAALTTLPLCTGVQTFGGRKCADYCDSASACDQYKEALKTGILIKKAE